MEVTDMANSIRVRHYTRVSSMRKIKDQLRIVARDQNKVFVEPASARKLSPADARKRYGLKPGKGRAYVEFDVESVLLETKRNARHEIDEYFIVGNVDLAQRNPQGFLNF
ncbi:MAG: hypothetical protein H7Z14_08995 [Anaerolineae bacterium]|nr:hypothetical protein [Phycisphaerae bacterium]